jgi:predicted nucleic acid-binding protein
VITYLDTSVIMRIVLREPEPLREWDIIDLGVTSDIAFIESSRTVERHRLLGVFDDQDLAAKCREVADILGRIDIVRFDRQVIAEASGPIPVIVGTLDAIHLASAVLYRYRQPKDERPIVFATHDKSLGQAARAMHFEVIGV